MLKDPQHTVAQGVSHPYKQNNKLGLTAISKVSHCTDKKKSSVSQRVPKQVIAAPLAEASSQINSAVPKFWNQAPAKKLRIAVIGAGITGIASAVECVDHGHEVTLYDDGDSIGGIWSKVNSFSGLQIYGLTYMFHPEVSWRNSFPQRDEILSQLTALWQSRGGPSWTKFNTPVTKVEHYGKDNDKWLLNGKEQYDGLIVATGTCHRQKWPNYQGLSSFKGKIVHSADLETLDPQTNIKDKKVVIIGSGASAIEALEWSNENGAAHTSIIARSKKWIIPRNLFLHAAVALMPLADSVLVSGLVRQFISRCFFKRHKHLVPDYDFYKATPCCNDVFFNLLDDKEKVSYHTATIHGFTENGVLVSLKNSPHQSGGHKVTVEKAEQSSRSQLYKIVTESQLPTPRVSPECSTAPSPVLLETLERKPTYPVPPPSPTRSTPSLEQSVSSDTFTIDDDESDIEQEVESKLESELKPKPVPEVYDADTIILATGYTRPSYAFMPPDMQQVPNDLLMLAFHPEHPTCLFNNGTYIEGVATAGSYHINVDTRLLLMFLEEPKTRPDAEEAWSTVRSVKRPGFLTYAAKIWWQLTFVVKHRDRWAHAPHVIFGHNGGWVKAVVRESVKTFTRTLGQKLSTFESLFGRLAQT